MLKKIMLSSHIEEIFSLDFFSSIGRPKIFEIKEKSRVLIFSPHPDDEVIGMGGALLMELERNSEISILYCTPKKEDERYNEAKKLCKNISVSPFFLECRDKEIQISEATKGQVKKLIKNCNPNKIYLPLFCDSHDDHKRTNELLWRSLKTMDLSKDLEIFSYQVYSFVPANFVLDITNKIENKKKLMSFYKSENMKRNWPHWNSGMNAYLSRFLKSSSQKKYAETFIKLNKSTFESLCSRFFRKKKNLFITIRIIFD